VLQYFVRLQLMNEWGWSDVEYDMAE
jgi:hypothetical protein